MQAELVLDAHSQLGEGPVWDVQRERLIWVDITGRRVHRFDPLTGQDELRDVGEHVGAAVLRTAGGLVLAVRRGFALLDFETGQVETIAETEAEHPERRMNDGKCDSAGRFWAGSMTYSESGREASLYCLHTDRRVTRVLMGVGLSNGLGWSPDDRLLYYIDTLAAGVDVFDYEPSSGQIRDRRRLIDVPRLAGFPDGMTVDAEGCLWVALWGGAAVRRYGPDGSLQSEVRLPARQVTSCTFGGLELGDLFITTAARGLTEQQLNEQPGAGGVFRCRPGVRGLPAQEYRG